MQNILITSRNILGLSRSLLPNKYRCLSTTTSLNNKWNPVLRQRNADVGRHVFEAFVVRTLIQQNIDMGAAEINEVTQGLVSSEFMIEKLQRTDTLKSIEDNEDLFNKLGELELRQDADGLESVFIEMASTIITTLSISDKRLLSKIQHPKYILKTICDSKNLQITMEISTVEDYKQEVLVKCGEKELRIEMPIGKSNEEIEHDVCLMLLNDHFLDEFNEFHLDMAKFISECDINLQPTASLMREISLLKGASESFGFTIRGGERKVVRNKQYIQQHIFTPVFISEIAADSPAEASGLMVGDVLLGVGDHSLQDCSHKQAVASLKRFCDVEEVTFYVKHVKKELLKYEAEQRFLGRQKDKIREEISSKNMDGRYHEAKAKVDPEEYLLEKLKKKKRPFQAKKHRQSLRLWDY